MSILHFERVIRDPLYGYIPITKLENTVIDTFAFQRLDRLSQMHSAHLVYPNARYSRKCHSLGVMHLAHRSFCTIICKQHSEARKLLGPLNFSEPVTFDACQQHDLVQNFPMEKINEKCIEGLAWTMQAVRLAGLLHDVGHAPMSHLFEDSCRSANPKVEFNHEEMSRRVISELLSGGNKPISKNLGQFVCQILKGQEDNGAGTPGVDELPNDLGFLHDLISGPIDCDKLDYVLRDAYHAGTLEYGKLDQDRILGGFMVKKGALLIDSNHLTAALAYLHSLFCMYSYVYYHKTCRSFDLSIINGLKEARPLLDEIASSPDKLIEYDDNRFFYEIYEDKYRSVKKYGKAWECIQDFFERKKRLRRAATKIMAVDLKWMADPENGYDVFNNDVKQMKDSIEKNKSPNIESELIVDIRAKIRYLGISARDINEWLMSPSVFDRTKKMEATLKEVDEAQFANLSQMKIPINVFMQQRDYEKIQPIISDEKEKISKELNYMVERIEDLFRGRHGRLFH